MDKEERMAGFTMREIVSTRQSMTLEMVQRYLKGLYTKPNSQRSFTDYYAYLDRTAGYLCKAIYENFGRRHFLREEEIQAMEAKFIRPISWLFTLSESLGIQLGEAFLKRFPEVCPYCLQRECVCFKTNQRPLQKIPAFRIQEEMEAQYLRIRNKMQVSGNDGITLDWAVQNITNIFGVNEIVWYYAGPWYHISKIHEEIAEIHEAYMRYKRGSVRLFVVGNEVADAFAWILGAWGIVFPERHMDDAFKNYYFDECPVCHSNPCQCDLYAGRPDGIIDYGKLMEIKQGLLDLEDLLPRYDEEIQELVRSIDAAITTQSEPVAKTSLSQLLERAEGWMRSGEGISNHALAMIENMIKIAITLSRFM